LDKVSTATR